MKFIKIILCLILSSIINLPASAMDRDVVDTLAVSGNFSILLKAIKAADLVETLKRSGPYTLFAPTDEAFAKLSKSKLNALMGNKTQLTALLKYCVVPAKITQDQFGISSSFKTLQGGVLDVSTSMGASVNGAGIVTPDIAASNGVIHAIDSLIAPE